MWRGGGDVPRSLRHSWRGTAVRAGLRTRRFVLKQNAEGNQRSPGPLGFTGLLCRQSSAESRLAIMCVNCGQTAKESDLAKQRRTKIKDTKNLPTELWAAEFVEPPGLFGVMCVRQTEKDLHARMEQILRQHQPHPEDHNVAYAVARYVNAPSVGSSVAAAHFVDAVRDMISVTPTKDPDYVAFHEQIALLVEAFDNHAKSLAGQDGSSN